MANEQMQNIDEITKPISLDELHKYKQVLIKTLSEKLEEEIEEEQFESDEDSDLWDTPAVDSKSVFKISPLMEKQTGYKVEPDWIAPGGYDDPTQAVTALIEQLELKLEKSRADNE